MSIADDILSELEPEIADEIRGVKKAANGHARGGSSVSGDSPFTGANAIDTAKICDRLGIEHDEKFARCPGCGEGGAPIALEKGGLKCSHNRCTSKGKRGYRTNVDLVSECKGLSPIESVNLIAEWFGFEGVRPKKVSDTAPKNGAARPPAWHGPTAGDPLRGLTLLAAVAILGRKRILELASKPVVYIWQDIALTGIVIVIAGGPGSGKTTLLFLILAARMNAGAPVKVLGRDVTPAPTGTYVVLIEAEHGDSSAARKLVKSCRLLGVGDEALDRVIIVARRGVRIGSPEWQEVGHMVAAGLVSDIALDTLARVAPADANDEREQVAIFDQVAQTIERAPSAETRPVVWTVAHTRKTETDELADVSGSTQRTGQADSVLMVKAERTDGRVTSSRVTFAKLREEPDDYPMPVEYTVTPDRIVDVDRPAEEDGRPLEERIAERLSLGPLTKTGLAKALKTGKPALEQAISNLFTAKQIVTADVTIKGTTYKGFTLKTDPVRTPFEPSARSEVE